MSRFINILDKIQNQPRYIRVQIMWLSVLICTAIAGAAWLTLSWHVSWFDGGEQEDVNSKLASTEIKESLAETVSVWSSLKSSVSALFEGDISLEEFEEDVNSFDEDRRKPLKLPLSR